jgi:hypothetical protein
MHVFPQFARGKFTEYSTAVTAGEKSFDEGILPMEQEKKGLQDQLALLGMIRSSFSSRNLPTTWQSLSLHVPRC